MDFSDIRLTDFMRIAMGNAPWWFLIEVVCRGIVMYLLLLVVMRLMGRRIGGQMSTPELAVVFTLGAAIGMPVQAPQSGLLAAAVVLLVAFVFQRSVAHLSTKSRRFEIVTQGAVVVLVEEGRVNNDNRAKAALSRDKVFSELRSQGILQLGQLRRVYLEAPGEFSLVHYVKERPGLPLAPEAPDAIANLVPRIPCAPAAAVEKSRTDPIGTLATAAKTRNGRRL